MAHATTYKQPTPDGWQRNASLPSREQRAGTDYHDLSKLTYACFMCIYMPIYIHTHIFYIPIQFFTHLYMSICTRTSDFEAGWVKAVNPCGIRSATTEQVTHYDNSYFQERILFLRE